MNKYEEFDNSLSELKRIESELNTLTTNDNVSLSQVMKLREEANTHYKNCNEVLKEIKDSSKQPTNE